MILLFIFYVDSISAAATVAKITCCRFVFAKREFGVGSWKNKIFTSGELLENSWFIVIINWSVSTLKKAYSIYTLPLFWLLFLRQYEDDFEIPLQYFMFQPLFFYTVT